MSWKELLKLNKTGVVCLVIFLALLFYIILVLNHGVAPFTTKAGECDFTKAPPGVLACDELGFEVVPAYLVIFWVSSVILLYILALFLASDYPKLKVLRMILQLGVLSFGAYSIYEEIRRYFIFLRVYYGGLWIGLVLMLVSLYLLYKEFRK